MAASAAPSPVGPDVPKNSASPWNRARQAGFEWVSPSPSPVEVAELERLFPDIIQAPTQSLEEEVRRWKNQAIIARSLNRWIPPEVLVREIHRAGISGDIEAIALANRHYLLKFDDASALPAMLERPWVVQGQPLAVAQWKEEFIPSENPISQALIWVRLPQLPIEFWSEDILASILAVAGRFLYADEATRNRKRGSFARACLSVDLSKPLRPGARIKGTGDPFWQQFSFENLDGICSSCGSLHLSGGCGAAAQSSVSSSAFAFGPWMAALRRRKSPQSVQYGHSAAPGSGMEVPSPPDPSEAWQIPKKFARRQTGRGGVGIGFSSGSVGPQPVGVAGKGVLKPSVLPVPNLMLKPGKGGSPVHLHQSQSELGLVCREGSSVPAGLNEEALIPDSQALVSVPIMSHSLDCPPNPFVNVDSCKWVERPKPRGVASGAASGPSKRARPVEPQVQRVVSKASKVKGKAQLKGASSGSDPFTFAASKDSPRGSDSPAGSRSLKSRRRDGLALGNASEISQSEQLDGSVHGNAVMPQTHKFELG